MNGDQWDNDQLADDQADDPAWVCDRCGDDYPADTGVRLQADWAEGPLHEWWYCEECSDSFTAWRLARDDAGAGVPPPDELADAGS